MLVLPEGVRRPRRSGARGDSPVPGAEGLRHNRQPDTRRTPSLRRGRRTRTRCLLSRQTASLLRRGDSLCAFRGLSTTRQVADASRRLTSSISYSPASLVQPQKGQTIALSSAIFFDACRHLLFAFPVRCGAAMWRPVSLSVFKQAALSSVENGGLLGSHTIHRQQVRAPHSYHARLCNVCVKKSREEPKAPANPRQAPYSKVPCADTA